MDKSILITGCSSGIGLCAAQTLQSRGYHVFATARKISDVEKLQSQGLESFVLDVDQSSSIDAGMDYILEKTGGTLFALFNNAGFALPGAVEDLTRDMMRKQFETNVFGAIELTNKVLPVMRKQGYGRIIMNTSILGIVAIPYRGAYNASKFALEGFSQTLRQELRDTPIKVSIIAPGPIETQFRANALNNYSKPMLEKNSVHQKAYKDMENMFRNTSSNEKSLTLSSDAVVKKLIHALESKSPKARYYVGLPAHALAFARRLFPDAWLDWLISKTL